MNWRERERRVAFLLLALAAVMSVASAALAVQITLTSSDVARIGGTGEVMVYCPANPCQVTKVTWTISSVPPFKVTAVNVQWTPATPSGSYTVYVVLYGNSGNVVGSGSTTQSGSSGPVTTTVNVSSVDPKDIYYVEVVIVQTEF